MKAILLSLLLVFLIATPVAAGKPSTTNVCTFDYPYLRLNQPVTVSTTKTGTLSVRSVDSGSNSTVIGTTTGSITTAPNRAGDTWYQFYSKSSLASQCYGWVYSFMTPGSAIDVTSITGEFIVGIEYTVTGTGFVPNITHDVIMQVEEVDGDIYTDIFTVTSNSIGTWSFHYIPVDSGVYGIGFSEGNWGISTGWSVQ